MKNLMIAGTLALSSSYGLAKDLNIATNPLGLTSNALTGSIDKSLTPYHSLGLEAGYLLNTPTAALTGYEVSGFELGIRTTLHQNHFDGTGFYAYLGASYGQLKIKNKVDDLISLSTISPKLTGGYQWAWDNGFNMKLGAGLKYIIFGGTKIFNDSEPLNSTTSLNLEFQVGYLI